MAKHKRPNGAGTLRRRTDGTWECRIAIQGVFDEATGKQKFKSFYARTQAEALRKAEEYQKNLKSGVLNDQEYTVAEWEEQFLPHHAEFAKLAESTQDSYRYTSKLINKYLGSKKLKHLKTYDVECMLMDLQDDGYSQSTISKVRGLLFQMCQAAVANEIISKNVVAYAAKMRYQKTTPRGCFTAEEVSKLMRELPINRDTLSLRLMLVSGLRKQEVMALNRDTIAPDGSYVVVKQAVSRKQGTTFISSAKSEASNRVVPIPERARGYAIMLRDCCTGSLIWESPRKPGKPASTSYFDDRYYAALEGVDVRKLSPHSTRRTFVSQLQAKGVPMETIRALCGHVDVKMTEVYLRVQDEVKLEAVNQLNDIC